MAIVLRAKTIVPLLSINKPSQAIVRDGADRITQWTYTYPSVTVTYDVTWAAASGSELTTITQTITDNP